MEERGVLQLELEGDDDDDGEKEEKDDDDNDGSGDDDGHIVNTVFVLGSVDKFGSLCTILV